MYGEFQQRKNLTEVLRETRIRRKTTTEWTEMKMTFNGLISRHSRHKDWVNLQIGHCIDYWFFCVLLYWLIFSSNLYYLVSSTHFGFHLLCLFFPPLFFCKVEAEFIEERTFFFSNIGILCYKVPLTYVLVASQNFWCVMFSFPFSSKYFLPCLLIYSLI